MAPRPANSFTTANSGPVAAAASAPVAPSRYPASFAAAVERCWRRTAPPEEWNLTRGEFEEALERSVAQRFSGAHPNPGANAKAIESYLDTLHVQDLALARACSAGNAAAWDFFVTRFRPELYRAARAIVGGSGGDAAARELADSLYADLYGLRESEGRRKSLLDYFHGRSKLSTWLHAVLAQRYVDEIRRTRRTEPLENEAGEERGEIAAAATPAAASAENAPPDPERAKYLAMLQAALTAALDKLAPRDRLRLAYYYVDERTLAEIGRLLGEHEATVSRKLDRARRDVRRRVEAVLRDGKKLSEAQVRLCCEYARGEWPFDLTDSLRRRADPAREPGALSARD
jgi:RNA polymerase sigma factor (sigma-70 family)